MNTTNNRVASTPNIQHKNQGDRAANRKNVAPVEGERPRLIFFYSPTSGVSRRVDGFLAQVLQRRHNHDRFELLRINHEARPEIAARCGVSRFPAIVVVEEKRVRARLEQPRGCSEIQSVLAAWLK